MLKKVGVFLLLVSAVVAGSERPASAQQTLNFTIGGFVPLGEDARVGGDVLNANLNSLVFDIKDFNGATVGAEWLVPIGKFVEGGAGLSFYRRTVPSVYDCCVDIDGTEIDQDLRLRIIPIAFTVRVLPLGQSSPVQPYFGAGLGILNWRYSETGEFIDTRGGIFRDRFVADGTATGPLVLGGLRFAGDTLSAGGEIRYQKADANLDDDRFEGTKIDLGGWTYQFNIGVRFGK